MFTNLFSGYFPAATAATVSTYGDVVTATTTAQTGTTGRCNYDIIVPHNSSYCIDDTDTL